MSNDDSAADGRAAQTSAAPAGPAQPAGRGKLAQLLATRGGTAAPEAPFVIEHREALIYMLCEAAELEHGIMCQYLFAAFSLKQAASEGLTEAQLAAVTRWRKQVSHVATQEMLHLALVHNLLSAIGAAPHLARPNLPQPASHYPAGVQLALLPFGEQALRHFMFLERPEGMDLQDAAGLAAMGRAEPLMNERDIVPRLQDFKTVGHLYRSVEAGFAQLAAKYGEQWLFVGPPRAQATQGHFSWPELVRVTDLASAQRAIDEILEQGEGPRGHWQNAHFGQFVSILDEYLEMTRADPDFEPVRPVIAANVRPPERDVEVSLITDPLTARVTDLFNVAYEVLLQIFERFFAHTEESDAQLKVLADATLALMLQVIRPLGDLITSLPVGGQPGRTAGPSFELFYENDYLMPHRDAAWTLLTERLDEAAWLCEEHIGFRDPVTGSEPTLFEWAGGLPALTRMTRLLYEKHVPADPLLAPLFADMPAGHPQPEARWLAEVFGGPAARESGGRQHQDAGPGQQAAAQDGGTAEDGLAAAQDGLALTEEQRARWVTLAGRAADEAGLPADPEFRSAFSGFLEWSSRAAAEASQPGAAQRTDVPALRWDWGPASGPAPPPLTRAPLTRPLATRTSSRWYCQGPASR